MVNPNHCLASTLNISNVISDMDKMVSIKGLVIRTTPVIPDMKTGENVTQRLCGHI